ncbi:MAG: hypothetical protein GY853_00620 [PVC group bacterium]|nr:hypothetical protein [PVC group bacterium]
MIARKDYRILALNIIDNLEDLGEIKYKHFSFIELVNIMESTIKHVEKEITDFQKRNVEVVK